ncbi:hypothetical protein COU59_01610 [Candidatus Pacearchaeota archaeon CG10_big_fil_rev_8_21_14_0_10_34_12]|nr:MAG: hypothetical protein COU59_01610 [Candidatus Pacearchaeota archaeon CG10_big_fil_rev_8_21_14_0_10_34_12]
MANLENIAFAVEKERLDDEALKAIREGFNDPKVVEVVLKKRGSDTPDCVNCGNRNGYMPVVAYHDSKTSVIYLIKED